MTVVTRSPGAVGTGPWTGFTVANLAAAGGGYAAATLNEAGRHFVQSVSAFGFAIPADATITSLTVEGQYQTSGEGSIALTPSQGEAATDGGNVPYWTVIQGETYTGLPTVAQLNSAAFAVTADAYSAEYETSWVYLDYITLTVEYDEYVPPPPPDEPPPPEATVPTVRTFSVTNITATSATGNGFVDADGGAAVEVCGVSWSTSQNPAADGISAQVGHGMGAFALGIGGLTPGTRYYVVAWAQNSAGVGYGQNATFVTDGVPAVRTFSVTGITATTAVGNGFIDGNGGAAVDVCGIAWSTSPNGQGGTGAQVGGIGMGAFALGIGGLTPGTRYYVYAWAHNSAGYGYGAIATFVTHGPPAVATAGIHGITATTATGGGDVAADGGEAVTARGVCWSVAENPTTAASKTTDGSGLGVFVSALTGLTNGATYNVRAYATNAVGTAYGAAVNFTAIAEAPPVEPPPGPPRDPSQNLLFDGTLELMVGTLDVAGLGMTQMKYSNSNPGGFGNLSFRLPADAPWEAFDAQVVKGAAVTMKHGLEGFTATLFEGEVTSDVSHATIAGGKAYYDVTCAGLWWKAGQRKDFSMVVGDDAYGQWYAMDDNANAFKVSTDGCLDIRLEAGQSAAAGDSASLYYWLGKGMGDPAASIDLLLGLFGFNVTGAAGWHARVWSAPAPWGPWTECINWYGGSVTDMAFCVPTLGNNPQALKLELSTASAVDALPEDRFFRLDKMSVGSGVSANGMSVVSVANPTVVTATSAHGLKTGDRVFITQSSASTPTISGWRTVTVTNATHFTVPVAVTTAGGAGTFYKATRVDQALVEVAVTTGLASLASLQPGGIGNLNWGLNVRPHASRAGSIDLLAATNVAPFDYGFWDNKTFCCQDRPETIRALHDYLIDSSLPGIDFDVRRATEDSPTVVKVLYKFRAEDGETSPYPDGTALAVYRTAAGYGNPAASANLIPTMTSATAPSGVASASSSDASFPPYKAFDHLNGAAAVNAWIAAPGTTGWLLYQFPSARVVTQYAVTTVNNGATPRAPKTWTFIGSNNGTDWTTLDTQTNITDWATSPNVRKVFSLTNATAYRWYAISITASNDATYVGVGELEMMETVRELEWSDASPVLDVWNEWADLSLTTAQAGDLGDQILAWLSANAYQGGGSIAPSTLPLRAEGTKPVAYIRAGDYIEDSNLDTGPLMITGFSMDADRGVASIAIGENRRAFVERLTPDKA